MKYLILAIAILIMTVPLAACEDNGDCKAACYCQKKIGDCNGAGVCTPRPTACPDIYDPVCGCDGKTYANACEAAMNGVNVAYPGVCFPAACHDNGDCPDALHYCKKATGDCNGAGVCTPRPAACPDVWDPVCGCDGKTYGNACEAAMNGVNIAHMGVCTSTGCRSNGACPDSQHYCKKEVGDCDGVGICTLRPTACPDIYNPVCGCDGLTYANACLAAMNGVNVAYPGPCAACVHPSLADLNNDCKVNLLDLMIMATDWLHCGYADVALCD